jgi:NitT/TauT family transport system permease protein
MDDGSAARLGAPARVGYGLAGVVVVLGGMQALVAGGVVSHKAMPLATEMLHRSITLLGTTSFLRALGDTLLATLFALVIAGAGAAVLGVLIAADRRFDRALSGLIDFLRPIPSVALLPVAILLFGLGTQMKVVLAVYAVFWPVLINTMYGVRDVDPVMLATARSFAWRRLRILRAVVIRAALPSIATGLRIGAAVSLIVVITAELLGAESGVGVTIRAYESANRTAYVYAGVLIVAIVGLLINFGLSATERRVVVWSPEHRR